MRTKYLSLLAMTAAVLVLTGCGHAMVTPQFVDPQTENVTIEVADGDWTIAPGELFKPQEVSALSPHGPMKAREIQSNLSMYTVPGHRDNVRDVTVKIDGNEELHGKIIFFRVYADGSNASAKRKWTVSVPDRYLDIARQGNVAVVYQPYKYNGQEWASWVLWMSKLPL